MVGVVVSSSTHDAVRTSTSQKNSREKPRDLAVNQRGVKRRVYGALIARPVGRGRGRATVNATERGMFREDATPGK